MRRRISEAITRRPGLFLTSIGVVGCILIGLGAYLGSQHPGAHDPWSKAGSIAMETVGGALLAAVLVGFLVDQVTRHRLSRETGEQWLWALLGEDTPPQLRDRAKEVISHGQAHLSVEVRCEMTWVEEGDARALRLRVRVLTDGVNHSRSDSYLPDGPAWAMQSVSGHKTRYLRWAFEVGDQAGARPLRRLEATDGLLLAHSHEKPPERDDFEPDGSIYLYQRDLIEEIADGQKLSHERRAAAPGERFRLERELEVFLDPTDFFPFFILVPTVGLQVKFMGDACRDLAIKARAAGTQLEQHSDDSGMKDFVPNAALLPGHVVIFSWHPREEPPADVQAAEAKEDAAIDPGAGAPAPV